MGNYELGQIYYINKEYDDDPEQSKRRPAIIVDIDEENNKVYTLVATTSKGKKNPETYHDQFKHPIYNWRRAGLTEPSWALCLTQLELHQSALLEYVGELEDQDYDRLLDFMDSL
ncbi:type II toxin-antitoxin system PemK/MazF family toxin [Sutcliffiella horikoshii]|uniref:type II toxin-antitoxin system PemK/MazF family toxin n=1 Tax=Sutcliffiella horikoshii TaxID=79883 RepID=UPI00203CD5CE|nr:type II toxin-antitoxin system PemK/MazF family toxin [Sutcliffiella horikoshii]MCM3616661.1 type II toxin-antitoxin system PemK/MazF family toxin [Sutcliffiella horikoshii]